MWWFSFFCLFTGEYIKVILIVPPILQRGDGVEGYYPMKVQPPRLIITFRPSEAPGDSQIQIKRGIRLKRCIKKKKDSLKGKETMEGL